MKKCPILGVWAGMSSICGHCDPVSADAGVPSGVLRRCEEPTGYFEEYVSLELLPIARFQIILTLHDV